MLIPAGAGSRSHSLEGCPNRIGGEEPVEKAGGVGWGGIILPRPLRLVALRVSLVWALRLHSERLGCSPIDKNAPYLV